MGPLLVEAIDEAIEAGLLLQQVFGRGLGGFLLERQVHALVSTVLLRVAGLDALDLDPQAQPPTESVLSSAIVRVNDVSRDNGLSTC